MNRFIYTRTLYIDKVHSDTPNHTHTITTARAEAGHLKMSDLNGMQFRCKQNTRRHRCDIRWASKLSYTIRYETCLCILWKCTYTSQVRGGLNVCMSKRAFTHAFFAIDSCTCVSVHVCALACVDVCACSASHTHISCDCVEAERHMFLRFSTSHRRTFKNDPIFTEHNNMLARIQTNKRSPDKMCCSERE